MCCHRVKYRIKSSGYNDEVGIIFMRDWQQHRHPNGQVIAITETPSIPAHIDVEALFRVAAIQNF